jgi:hypothetical protein
VFDPWLFYLKGIDFDPESAKVPDADVLPETV